MKAKQIAITSGPAAGTLVTRVESNSGKLLGFIRVVAVGLPHVTYPTLYIAERCIGEFGHKLCDTLASAYSYLGVSLKELDNSDLGEYPYDEYTPKSYWLKNL